MTTTITLDDVLAAAGARKVALAPETSGYLVLAIADALSRLPFAIEAGEVALTTEGTIVLGRRGALLSPADAAERMREALARLLGVSSGTAMPGLTGAARPRAEVDLDGVIASIEAALIPVNRAAGRRAIARLAREAARLGTDALRALPRRALEEKVDVSARDEKVAVSARDEHLTPPMPLFVPKLAPVVLASNEASATAPAEECEAAAVLEASGSEPAEEADETATDVADAPVTVIDARVEAVEAVEAMEADPISRAMTSSPPPAPAKDVTPTLLGVGAVGVQLAAALLAQADDESDDQADDESADQSDAARIAIASVEDAPLEAATASEDVDRVADESVEAPMGASAASEDLAHENENESASVTGFPPGVDPHDALTIVPGDVEPIVPLESAASTEDRDRIEAIAERVAAHAAAMPVREASVAAPSEPARAPSRSGTAELLPASASDVDALISGFGVTDARDPKRVASSLKQLAGLELTEAPPVVWESPRPVAAAPTAAREAWEPEPMTPTPPPVRRARRRGLALSAAVLAIGVVTTGALWRFRDDVVPWLEQDAAEAAPAPNAATAPNAAGTRAQAR